MDLVFIPIIVLFILAYLERKNRLELDSVIKNHTLLMEKIQKDNIRSWDAAVGAEEKLKRQIDKAHDQIDGLQTNVSLLRNDLRKEGIFISR